MLHASGRVSDLIPVAVREGFAEESYDVAKHCKLKSRLQSSSAWACAVELAEDTLKNADYMRTDNVNAFSPRKYSFQEAWYVAEY